MAERPTGWRLRGHGRRNSHIHHKITNMSKITRIQKNAIKASQRAVKKKGDELTKEDLMAVKVQTMSGLLRFSIVFVGVLLILGGAKGVPFDHNVIRSVEAVIGVILVIGGTIGIRRTLDTVVDTFDAVDILSGVSDAIGGIFDW